MRLCACCCLFVCTHKLLISYKAPKNKKTKITEKKSHEIFYARRRRRQSQKKRERESEQAMRLASLTASTCERVCVCVRACDAGGGVCGVSLFNTPQAEQEQLLAHTRRHRETGTGRHKHTHTHTQSERQASRLRHTRTQPALINIQTSEEQSRRAKRKAE